MALPTRSAGYSSLGYSRDTGDRSYMSQGGYRQPERRDWGTTAQRHGSAVAGSGYDGLVRRRYGEETRGRGGYRSSSPRIQRGYGAREPERERPQSYHSSSWRSKSWETSPSSNRSRVGTGDGYGTSGDHLYSTFGRETSLIRERMRNRHSLSSYSPPRDSLPLQDQYRVGRARHQSLTHGVPEEDLMRARTAIHSNRRLSDDAGQPTISTSYARKPGFRHSLPDVFDSLPDTSLMTNSTPANLGPSNTMRVSFRSPEINDPRPSSSLISSSSPSVSSSAISSSVSLYPPSLSPMLSSRSVPDQSNSAQPFQSHIQASSTVSDIRKGDQNDSTLKLLQQHYMDAIHTLTPPKQQQQHTVS